MRGGIWFCAVLAAIAAAPLSAQMQNKSDLLLEAIRYDEFGKVQNFVKDDPGLVNTRSITGETPLLLAIDKRSIQMLGFLLFHKADPNGGDRAGQTPLILAARKGWGEGVDALIEMGAKVDGRNRQGETALIAAVQARSVRVVRQLLARGADPDIADRIAGLSARDYARRENRLPELLRLIEAAKPAR